MPATTSWVDGITFTADGETNTYDFELAAAPPTDGGGGPTVTVPPTDLASPVTAPEAIETWPLVVLGVVLTAVILADFPASGASQALTRSICRGGDVALAGFSDLNTRPGPQAGSHSV